MAGDDQYGHIKDTDTVFMRSPLNEGVGSCLGAAFKQVHGPNGYIQISKEDWTAGMALLEAEKDEFAVGGRIAPLPDGEPEAQDVINADARQRAGVEQQDVSMGEGFDVPAGTLVSSTPKSAKHRGEG